MSRLVTNPMILKELRQRLREGRAWLLPTLYLDRTRRAPFHFAYYAAADPEMGGSRGELQGADIGEVHFPDGRFHSGNRFVS